MRRLVGWAGRLGCVLAIACSVMVPAIAVAEQAVVENAHMDVQIWPEAAPGRVAVIASVVVPETTKLPATVRVPVVPGSTVEWVGEIGAADPSQDPTRTYTIESGMGADFVEFTVKDFRIAQVEMTTALQTTAGASKLAVDWVQSVPAELTAFSVRLPAGTGDVEIQPAPVGQPEVNEAGERLFTLPNKEMKPGESTSISGTYAVGGANESGTGSVLLWLVGALAFAVIALVFVVTRQRGGR